METSSASLTAEEEERFTAKTPRGRELATGRFRDTQPENPRADNLGMERAEPPKYLDDLAREVIGAAIAVHRILGPGFLESIYEAALAIELSTRGIEHERQVAMPVFYRDALVGEHRLDLLVAGELVIELKAVERFTTAHVAQTMSYMRAGGFRLGLLLNFHAGLMRDGIRRVVSSP
jgi:GxxExxY protein